MKCPACGNKLKEGMFNHVKLDICDGGCGGVWFDNFELKKFDEKSEETPQNLINIKVNRSIRVDHSKKRNCPKCGDIVMIRHFHSPKKGVEVDECGKCAGVWLDMGELAKVRAEFATEKDRVDASLKMFDDFFGAEIAGVKAESRAKLDKLKSFAGSFKGSFRFNFGK